MLLRKGVYPYDYMDESEKFNGTSLREKHEFYINLNMEGITDADNMHGKRVCKDFEKKLGENHDLYLKHDTLFLADVFEHFREMCSKIYCFRSFKTSFSSLISMASSFKKD